jgi:hypothetical protein
MEQPYSDATGCDPTGQSLGLGSGKIISSMSSKTVLGLCLLSHVYRGLFPGKESGRSVNLIVHQSVPRSGILRPVYPLFHTPS